MLCQQHFCHSQSQLMRGIALADGRHLDVRRWPSRRQEEQVSEGGEQGEESTGGVGHNKVCVCKQSKDPVTAECCLILGLFRGCNHHTETQAIQ